MLSCTEISFLISFFDLEKFGDKPGFPFLDSHCSAARVNHTVDKSDTNTMTHLREH